MRLTFKETLFAPQAFTKTQPDNERRDGQSLSAPQKQ